MIDVEGVPNFEALVAQTQLLDPDEAVRQLLLRLAELQARQREVKGQRDRILDLYEQKLGSLDDQIDRARDSIHACIVRKGDKVVWPDLGAAFLSKQAAKLAVTHRETFHAWATEAGFVKEVVDETEAKKAGALLVETTGEIPPGAEYLPPSERLTVRMDHSVKS